MKETMAMGLVRIVIGQADEFEYFGTQACKALRSLGYENFLVNSNPAAIRITPAWQM